MHGEELKQHLRLTLSSYSIRSWGEICSLTSNINITRFPPDPQNNHWHPYLNEVLGYLPFTPKILKLRMEIQMVLAILCGKLKKLWTAGRGDTHFSLFLAFPADLALHRNVSFSDKVRLSHVYSLERNLAKLFFVTYMFLKMLWSFDFHHPSRSATSLDLCFGEGEWRAGKW